MEIITHQHHVAHPMSYNLLIISPPFSQLVILSAGGVDDIALWFDTALKSGCPNLCPGSGIDGLQSNSE